jgi:putative FmdB family regulatory protein
MPFYEFECECGQVTEELVKMGTEEIACPQCGKTAHKIMSRCSFSLKGGGWYADGYASPGGGAKTAAKSDSTAASSGSDSGKSESKSTSNTSSSGSSGSDAK